MKYFRLPWLSILLITFCFLLFWSQRAGADQKDENNVCFRWAFGAMVGSENERRLVAITRDTTLKTGNQLKLLVELKKKCFVYLIYHSGQNELHMLFPYETKQFSKDPETRKKYYIPQGTEWFELDEKTGPETFYLLASAERLNGLEVYMCKPIRQAGALKGSLGRNPKGKKAA
jgi:hypothetical protein